MSALIPLKHENGESVVGIKATKKRENTMGDVMVVGLGAVVAGFVLGFTLGVRFGIQATRDAVDEEITRAIAAYERRRFGGGSRALRAVEDYECEPPFGAA